MWIVVNIGCIECGVDSALVGLFSSKEKADEIAAGLYKTHGWRQGGRNAFEVFELPAVVDEVAKEYRS